MVGIARGGKKTSAQKLFHPSDSFDLKFCSDNLREKTFKHMRLMK